MNELTENSENSEVQAGTSEKEPNLASSGNSDVVSQHFNQLSPAEAERVALILEECGEVVQVCGKILRHGFDSCHPNGGSTNRELLEKELGDVEAAIQMMNLAGDIADCRVKGLAVVKSRSVQKYLHHQAG